MARRRAGTLQSMLARTTRTTRVLAGVACAIVVLALGLYLGGHPGWMPSGLRSAFVQSTEGDYMQHILDLVDRDYFRRVNISKLANAGLTGAVASLHDPYSHYYTPATYRSFEQITNPTDDGIGIEVLPDPHGLLVAEAFPGSPAARAGLQHGDLIVAVGRTSLAGRSATFAARLIQGRPGTRVTITVLEGTRRRVLTLTRANISIPVASSRLLHYDGRRIGYLQFTQFSQGSGDELRSQVRRMLADGAQGLILDLRDNGGGLLAQAINVASIFIPSGTIVTTRGRAVGEQVYTAQGNAIAPHIPLVVLVNRGTASSAEIVTAALKDHGRAEIVGTNTYGKGVFQEVRNFANGAALELTVGEYFTPNGHNLGGGGVKEGPGITPNVYVPEPPHALGDPQLTAAERVLVSKIR
jgi:carboxyl-terminal processing protease